MVQIWSAGWQMPLLLPSHHCQSSVVNAKHWLNLRKSPAGRILPASIPGTPEIWGISASGLFRHHLTSLAYEYTLRRTLLCLAFSAVMLVCVTNRQLSDVNRDGALSLDEFCTAMHLVVLRRNDIELPDTLPPVLQPYTPLVSSGTRCNSFLSRGA